MVLWLLAVSYGAAGGLVGAWDAADAKDGAVTDRGSGRVAAVLREAAVVESLGRQSLVLSAPEGSIEVRPGPGDGWPALTLLAIVDAGAPDAGYQGIACRDCFGGPEGDVFGLLIDDRGQWAARLTTAAGPVGVSHPAAPGWHLVAMVYTGAEVRLVVDGQEVGRAPASGRIVSAPETPLAIASYANRRGPLRGGVARVEIHDETLATERIAALWAQWQEAHPEDGFAFAQVSDVHITDTRSIEIVNDVVDRINADPAIAFSLWLGDLTQAGHPDEMALARLALKRLQRPAYVLPGNHDTAPGVYEKEFGPGCRRVSVGGWTFLLLDTNPGDNTPVAPERLAWLQREIDATPPATPVVLCTHHPLMPHTKAYLLAGAPGILKRFAGHALRACLAGHYHGNQEEVVDGILFTTTACCSSTRGNHDGTTVKGFRRFACQDGQIRSGFVPLTRPDTLENGTTGNR